MKHVVLVFGLMISIAALQATELVKNGNFETDLASWRNPQGSHGKVKCYSISPETKFGKGCLLVSGDPGNKYNSFNTLIQQLPELKQGTDYLLRFQAKTAVPATAKKYVQVAVRQINAANRSILYSAITLKLTQKDWNAYQLKFTPRNNAVKYQLYVIEKDLDKEDKVSIDNLSLTPVTK